LIVQGIMAGWGQQRRSGQCELGVRNSSSRGHAGRERRLPSPGEYKEFRTKISPLGLSWCVIPLRKYSAVYGRLIRAKLTWGHFLAGGRTHRDSAAVLLELLRGLTE